jgi:hypothetical protein
LGRRFQVDLTPDKYVQTYLWFNQNTKIIGDQMADNPLLQKIQLPGRVFQLPSRGIFYKNGELEDNIKEGEIHVHPMSALAEIHMKNPDQLFSGQAVETVFKECVKGIAKPAELLSKDVDAIMMFLRTVTYGNEYVFTARHNCENGIDHSYTADVDHMINTMGMIDPTTVATTFTVTMPNEQVVKLSPSKYSQIITLLKANEGKKEITVEDQKNNLMIMLSSVVCQVDDTTDPAMIREWLSKIETTWVSKIAERVEAVNEWGPSLKWSGNCRDCGEEFTVELPINPVSFFTE